MFINKTIMLVIQLEFKSIAVGNGLTLTDANDTLTLECTISTAGFLQATNNLSDLGDAATARTNLDVYSKAEADAKYFRVDPLWQSNRGQHIRPWFIYKKI